MQFTPWLTDYDNFCRGMHRKDRPSHSEFVRMRVKEFAKHKTTPYRLIMEVLWHTDGRPYYNVHPGLVPSLSRINLEKIPSHLIVVPDPFTTVHMAFAQAHPELTVESTLSGPKHQTITPGSSVRGILMTDSRRIKGEGRGNGMCFCLDFGIFDKFGQPTYAVFTLGFDRQENLQELLSRSIDKKTRDESYRRVCTNALRLAVTIGFLSNSKSELIEPDVLAKLRDAYQRGNEATKQRIVEKSRRRGKNGFNVGNDLIFVGAAPVRTASSQSSTGKELQYQHIRGGHPHAVRYGPGKRLVKIMWFQPTQVRPDLPFKSSGHQPFHESGVSRRYLTL